MKNNLIEISSLSKNYHTKYGEIPAIEEINLNIDSHDIIAILGPSGCGKSTLLSIIAGLDKESSGVVNKKKDLSIAYMLQNDALFNHLTIYENALLGLKIKKLLDNESRLLFYKDINPIIIIGNNDTSKIDELLSSEVEYSYSIVLTHKPDNFDVYKDKNIDLVLAGHSLNGQVRIPFYGGVIKRNGGINYIDSYYEKNNTNMIVSNGLGTIKYNIRLFNRPSINLIRFTK